MSGKFYITTPLYYVNDVPHIGHAYTQVAADALARYKRLTGNDVFFLTGTDEHGEKVEKAALSNNKSAQKFVDDIVVKFNDIWKQMQISNDDFIRTTQKRHLEVVSKVFQKLYDQGDIYKDKYTGWYCTPCESFCLDSQLVDGNCPECGRLTQNLSEDSYFFRMSKYQGPLLDYIRKNPMFIMPVSRRNEVINFIESGLEDLSVSRSSFSWGVPVPFDKSHVVYVWFDALLNYITGVDYERDKLRFDTFWPADVHIIGKDILKFHAVIWPAMLLALEVKLPTMVFAHGWWTVEGEKMSKSRGNMILPQTIIDEFGLDALRYFLLREIPFGLDGNFSRQAFILRFNADLANDLGNLLNRSLPMLQKYFNGEVPMPNDAVSPDNELKAVAEQLPEKVDRFMEKLQFNQALIAIWELVKRSNKYIDEVAPWRLFKEDKKRLCTVMYNVLESLRIIALFLKPFMPDTSSKMYEQLGILKGHEEQDYRLFVWGKLQPNTSIKRGKPLFPRIVVLC